MSFDLTAFQISHTVLIRLLSILATLVASYGVGHGLRLIGSARLARLAKGTSAAWDDVVVSEITRRIPFWTLLAGIHFTLPQWPITLEHQTDVQHLLSVVGITSVTFAVAAAATRLVVVYGQRAPHAIPVSGLSQNVIRIVVTLLGLMMIVESLDYDIKPLLTALGVGGLAVALALQEPLSNLFAGIFVALARQIRIGDYVRLDSGAEGYVVDFNWRSTRLRQLGDNLVLVPNAKLSQAIVTNYDLPGREMGIGVDVTVDVASDLEKVERIALAVAASVARDVSGAVPTAEPSVRFSSFVDTGVRFSVGLRVQGFVDQYLVKHELVKRLHAQFQQQGIVVPVESRTTLVHEQPTEPS